MGQPENRPGMIARLKEEISVFKKLVPYLGKIKPLLFWSVLLGLVSIVIESMAVGVVVFFVFKSFSADISFPDNQYAAAFFQALEDITGESLYAICALILFATVLKTSVRGGYNLLGAHIVNTVHHRVRAALFEKYLSLPYKELAKKDYGAMANTLQVESWFIPEVIKSFSSLLICVIAMAVYMSIIVIFSWPLALLIIAGGLLLRLIMAGLKRPLRQLGFETTKMHEELSLRMYTRMQGLKTIRSHGLEQGEIDHFAGLSERVARAFTHMTLVDTYLKPFYDISMLLIIGALLWSSYMLGNEIATTATIIALLYKLQPYFYGLEGALMSLMKSEGPLQAVLGQLEGQDIRDEDQGQKPFPMNWQCLRFERVGFAYDQETILKDLSFDLKRGQLLAVTGASGAGKSTLINLFLKLTRPDTGRILLDDIDFNEINRHEWLKNIGAAGQDFSLFDGTLRENLTFGQDIAEETLQKALKIAEADEILQDLPNGLDTKMGERGLRLSGGQRQRIVLARALAFAPELLILDEATSEVSLAMEKKIYKNIKAHYPEITILLITHRMFPEDIVDVKIAL